MGCRGRFFFRIFEIFLVMDWDWSLEIISICSYSFFKLEKEMVRENREYSGIWSCFNFFFCFGWNGFVCFWL